MENIQREDIHLVAKHSNLSANAIDAALRDQVYPKAHAWHDFLRLFLLIFGVGFSLLGIVFFFAYNWADLPKFTKLGLVEGLLILLTGAALYPKFSPQTRKIVLSGSALIVGLLFAVFGQIYQTGANAYDFFLAWTVFISIWVLIANFTPLWLFFLLLINSTLILYQQQVAADWSPVLFNMALALINAAALCTGIGLSKSKTPRRIPTYFSNVLSLASVSFATLGIVIGIFEHAFTQLAIAASFTALGYTFALRHAWKQGNGFYMAIVSFSLIIIASAILLDILEQLTSILLVSGFLIGSVTYVVHLLIHLQKTKTHGTTA